LGEGEERKNAELEGGDKRGDIRKAPTAQEKEET